MELVNGLKDYDKKRFADPYGNGVQRFDRLTKYVDMAVKGLGDNTSSAIEVAKALYCIREEKLYEDYPVPGAGGVSVFQDFNSFCKEVFKCGKSTIYNYLALYERFGSDGEAKTVAIPSKCIKTYTYSQLLLMTSLPDAELLNIKPEMSFREIKKYVKDYKEKNRLNSKRLEKTDGETEEQVEESTSGNADEFDLKNPSQCSAFLDSYLRWHHIVEFCVGRCNVDFYDISLGSSIRLVVGRVSCGFVLDVSYYIYDIDSTSDGFIKNAFSLSRRLPSASVSLLLSELPVSVVRLEKPSNNYKVLI